MKTRTERFVVWVRRSILRFGAMLLVAGCAVTSPQGQPVAEQYVDPPARVGRISYLAGNVTLTDTLHGDRDAATLNWPITSAQRLTSGPDGIAEVRIGSLAVYLDVNSAVEFTRIDDDAVRILVRQGSVALRPRSAELLVQLQVVTPREEVMIEDAGRYRVDVDRTPGITSVTTEFGQARIVAGGGSYVVAAGLRGESLGSYGDVRLVPQQSDGFDNWVAERDRRDEQLYAERYVAPETTGIESLDEHGTWRTVESYGTVWVPRSIPVGWAPYRYGRWAWIAPWGWTWIDDAPWGFAPFHYGRWVVAGGGWCWVPGAYVRRPVYAPALVAWYGSPGVSVAISSGAPIGWFPLGPGEVYVPGYHVSRRYVNAINVQHVRNIDHVAHVNAPPRYINQIHPDAVTYAPPRALPGRMRIQEVATRAPSSDVTRVSAQPRPPLTIDERLSKRRLVPAGSAVATAPSTFQPMSQGQPSRPAPIDGARRPGDNNGRALDTTPPGRTTAPGQERAAPPFVSRPSVVQDSPPARPDGVPPPKRVLPPQGNDVQAAPATPAPQRAEPPRSPQGMRQAAPQPLPQGVPQPAPQLHAAPPIEVPNRGVPAPRAQTSPPAVRQPPPKVAVEEPRGRGPEDAHGRGQDDVRGRGGDNAQRSAPRDR